LNIFVGIDKEYLKLPFFEKKGVDQSRGDGGVVRLLL